MGVPLWTSQVCDQRYVAGTAEVAANKQKVMKAELHCSGRCGLGAVPPNLLGALPQTLHAASLRTCSPQTPCYL